MHIHRVTYLKLSQNLNSYLNEAAMCPQSVGEQIFKFELYLYQSYLIISDGSVLSRLASPSTLFKQKIVILINVFLQSQTSFPHLVCYPDNQIDRIEAIFAPYFPNIMLIIKIWFFWIFATLHFFQKIIFYFFLIL